MPATVEELLGARPEQTVDDLLGPQPPSAKEVARSDRDAFASTWNRADSALDLAARNFQLESQMPSYDEMARLGIVQPNTDFNVAKSEPPLQVGLDVPLFNLGDFMLKDPKDAKSPAEAGVIDALRPTLNSLTSPKNLGLMAVSMGVASTGQVAAKLVSALWAAFMGKNAVENAPEIGAELGKEFAKPEGERDPRRIAQLLTQGGVDAAFTALPAAHAIEGPGNIAAGVSEKFNDAVKSAKLPEPSETLPETQPTTEIRTGGEPSPSPTMGVTVEDLLGAKPKIQPKAALPNLPRNTFRPEVPETPAEPYETVLETIRNAGAETIGDIQKLFPKRELTREEARALRDQAWSEEYKQQQLETERQNERPENQEPQTSEIPDVVRQPVEAGPEKQATAGVAERPGESPQVSIAPAAQEETRGGGPTRTGQNPVERAEAARPWDLIDEVEGNVGGLSLASAKKLDPDWSPTGAARKLFKEGGQGIDQAAEAIRRTGVAKLPKDEDLLYELDKAAEARKIWRKDFYEGEQAAEEQARGQEQFEKDVAKWKRPHEAVVADELMPGDEFELQGEKVTVKHLDFDEHGDVSHVILEDGTKYGTVQVPAGTVIRMDPKSLSKGHAEAEWEPEPSTGRVAESRILSPPSGQAAAEKTSPAAIERPYSGGVPPQMPKTPSFAESRAMAAAQATERSLRAQEQEKNGSATAGKQLERTGQAKKKWFIGLRSVFAPVTIDDAARTTGGIIRHALGKEYESMRQADFQLKAAQKEFDRTPVGRSWTYDAAAPLPRNYEVMRAIDTGDMSKLTPMEQSFAKTMRGLFDEAIEMVQKVSPNSLRDLVENYFPRIWKDGPTRTGQPSREVVNQLLSKKPWEGPKSFLKKRVLEYFTDGLEMGLQPVSDNPVDVTLLKLGEMYRFAATRRAIEEAKERGLRKFVYTYERPPEGWREVKDPSSSVYAPPVVTIKEAYDAQMRAKTLEMLQQLGVPHERLAQIGGQRWGFAVPPGGGEPRAQSGAVGTQRPARGGNIVTKFAGPDSVIWHEMGHQVDWKYPDLRRTLGATSRRSKLGKQLAALADLRFEGAKEVEPGFKRYVRETEEKIANVFEAYLHAPEKFKQTAPDVLSAFEGWLEQHPEVKNPLKEIKPSLRVAEGETQMDLGGPVLLGRWMMPEGAAQVVDNYLSPGLGKFKTFRSLREISGLLNGVQLLGFFHGQFVMNDSFYSGIGLATYDVLQKKPIRALKELVQIPISPFTSVYRGHKIKAAIENPAGANAEYRQMAKLAVEQNLRAGHGNFDPQFSRRWVRAFHEALSEPSAGAAWETFWRAPMAAIQMAMKPVMDLLVPRMKLGIYARMAARVMEDYGNAEPEILRRKLAEAADATEDRLGQVTYDNLFQHRAVKDAGQLAMRAYGWQLTKYRMIGGGIGDWARAANALVKGQKPDVTFRMTYLPAMALGHAIIGGLLGYALTGKRPERLLDYLFPKSGMVDAHGNPVRLSIADFVKDVVADVHGVMTGRALEEWSRKLAPFWNMAAEMYRNADFWNTRIFSERQLGEPGLEHLLKNLKEGAEYLGKTALPFSLTGGQRMAQTSKHPGISAVAPFFGIVPAPRYAVQTPAEARASEITRDDRRTPEQAKHAQDVAALIEDIRKGTINSEGEFQRRARAANVKDQAELTRIKQRVLWTPLQYQVYRMPLDRAMEVFDLADANQRKALSQMLAEKIQRAYDAGKLDETTARRYVQLVKPFYVPKSALPTTSR